MTKDVLLTISGLQFNDMKELLSDDESHYEPVEVVTAASYYEKEGTHYIFYEEVEEGYSEPIKNRLTLNQDMLEIRKNGLVNTHLLFEQRRRTNGMYDTPYGRLMLGITTGGINLAVTPESISIDLSYDLDINCEPLLSCQLRMSILPRTSAAAVLA